jgi:hypothetical protein
MERVQAWHHLFGECAFVAGDAAPGALVAAGVRTRSYGEGAAGPGIVFLDEVSEALCGFVCEASQGGRERLLAVAGSRAALTRHGAWRLLRAGASDAFA